MKNPQQFLEKIETATTYDGRLKIFAREYLNYKKTHKKPLKILDIGCGNNVELAAIKIKTDKYYGCDFFKKIDTKIDVYKSIDLNKDKLDEKFKNVKFDVIFCGEVIEHLFSPDHLLDEIKQLMHKRSILILSTPNLGYYINRILLLFGISPLYLENSSEFKLGRRFGFLGQKHKTEGHIKVFTYGALKDLFNIKRLKIVKVIPTNVWNFWPDIIIGKIFNSLSPDNIFILRK